MVSDLHDPTAELWQRYLATRARELRDRLVELHMPLARQLASIAAAKLPRCVVMGDIESAAAYGLVTAVERFSPDGGTKFATFAAHRIRGAIIDWLRDVDQVSRSARSFDARAEAATAAHVAEHGAAPTDEQLAARMGFDVAALRLWRERAVAGREISTESLIAAGCDSPIDLPGPCEEPGAAMFRRAGFARLMRGLNADERAVLALYYVEQLTQTEIGTVLDVTESRVSQLRMGALARLRGMYSRHQVVEMIA